MALSISAGYTFGATETVTADKPRQLIESASISGIARGNLESNFHGITAAASEPSGLGTGEGWYDTAEGRLKVYDGTAALSVAQDLESAFTYNDPASEGNLTVGGVVISDSSANDSVTQTLVASDEKVVWVCFDASVADTASARILREGLATIACETGVSRGEYLYTSTNYGRASGDSARGAGAFAVAMQNEVSNAVWALLFGQPLSAVPAGAIIMWDNSTTCPAGWTEVTGMRDRFARGWGGTATADVVNTSTGGVNTYGTDIFSGVIARTSDSANATMSPSLDVGIETDKFWLADISSPSATASTYMRVKDDGGGINDGRGGDHQHNLSGVENQPAYYGVLFCEKDA